MSILDEIFGSGIVRNQSLVKAEHDNQGVYVGIRRTLEVRDDGYATTKAATPTITIKQRGAELTIALAPDVAADIADALDQAAHTARSEASL